MTSTLPTLSNNQIDKLGERLKLGSPSDEDVTMLSSYRSSFFDAAKAVADRVREISGLEVTARSLKTTLSIVAKLKRDGVKQLSAMQDIGGCRVTVPNLIAQDELVEKLMLAFPDAKLYDRVAKPSHGYRAKHLVVKVEGRRIEIQVRTAAQHQWALYSEAVADLMGQNLKYGLGDNEVLEWLSEYADFLLELDEGLMKLNEFSFETVSSKIIRDKYLKIHELAIRNGIKYVEELRGLKK